ncbi:hypothetical protein ACFQRC_08340 [Enterovirga sp. GCM10030262]|uniref:hypothetical protein n=1 Tax=Enterovirga sp. GCM10030262 TaxID=3273391 RepID=UPI00360A1284
MAHPIDASAHRLRHLRLASAAAALMLAGAAHAQDPAFRIRSDFQAPLNADAGWAGEPNAEVTVPADRPFRLRMEIEQSRAPADYRLQARRNGGRWETVEAHDFPYPQRELKLDFDEGAPGSTPPGWVVVAGAPKGLAVVEDGPRRVMRAGGGQRGMVALYEAPWPLPEFTLGARFRLPVDAREGFALVFGYVDANNHGRIQFDPDGHIRVIRVVGGRETVLRDERANIARGAWHEAEIQLEGEQLEVNFDDDTLEFAVPVGGKLAPTGHGILAPAAGQVDIAEIVLEGEPRTPRVSIVVTPAYAHGEETGDLLSGSNAPFAPGIGLSLRKRTPRWAAGTGRHGEFEWPIVIRRHADGPAVNEAGDHFEFRMVDSAGEAVPAGPVAKVRLSVPAGHLGGTFVETPGRIGPWQATNGDLYFIMEPTETDNKFMMMKSADGGRSWSEVDGANRPDTRDLESVDGRQVGDRIHIIHQVTHSVRHHVFRTSDHPTHPDSWAIRDELAAEAEAVAQMATLAVRSDGSMVTVFLADRLHYAIRAADGRWSLPVEIDPEAAEVTAGPQAILGRDDIVHLAYFSADGSIWYRRLLPDGTLTARRQLASGAGTSRAEYGAVLPLAFDEATDTLFIVYRLADGTLWERKLRGGSAPAGPVMISGHRVMTDAVDSQQPAADLVNDGDTAHLLFADEGSRSLFSTRDEAGWQPPVLLIDGIEGSWVRGNIIRKPDGSRVYGFVYDAGSQGGAGLNRYAEVPLDGE